MIDYAMQVIAGVNVQLLFDKVLITGKGGQVKVLYWEIYQIL